MTDDAFRLVELAPDRLRELAGCCEVSLQHRRLSDGEMSPSTAGTWRVDLTPANRPGSARRFFVKLLRHPARWPGLVRMPPHRRADFLERFQWRFELDLQLSGIDRALPDGMRTPQLHAVHEPDFEHVALWWEYVEQRGGSWSLHDYERAARLLGRLAARRRVGAAINLDLPAFARDLAPGQYLRHYVQGQVIERLVPTLEDGRIWSHPTVAAALRHVGAPDLPGRLLTLGRRLPAVLDLLDRLPQAHAHGDAAPRNLLIPAGAPQELVVVDWGFVGPLAVGFDLEQLWIGLIEAGRQTPDDLLRSHMLLVDAYVEGLCEEGWQVGADVVRIGSLGSLAARSALQSLPVEMLAAPPDRCSVQAWVRCLQLEQMIVELLGGMMEGGGDLDRP